MSIDFREQLPRPPAVKLMRALGLNPDPSQVEDKGLMLKRCRDVVNNDSERLILVFDDNDVCALLGFVSANERKKIDEYLEDKLKEILA